MNIYDYKVKDANGDEVSLKEYEGSSTAPMKALFIPI